MVAIFVDIKAAFDSLDGGEIEKVICIDYVKLYY